MTGVLENLASPVLALEDLWIKRVGQGSGKGFVLHVDALDVHAGERVGLVGRSGSGKTTLLEMLGLLVWPDQVGRFEVVLPGSEQSIDLCPMIRSRRVDTLASIRARTIGFVLQDSGLLPYLSVRENALLAARLSEKFKTTTSELVIRIAEDLGIASLLDRLPARLSGGERQRAAVLRALAPSPNLLFVDEPTAPLDHATSRDVMAAIVASSSRNHAGVICASHDEELLQANGFRILRFHISLNGERVHAELRADENIGMGI